MIVETDSQVAYEGLSGSHPQTGFNGGLLEACKDYCCETGGWCSRYTCRKCNMVADWIAS